MRLGSQPVVLAPGHRCPIVTVFVARNAARTLLCSRSTRSLTADWQFVGAVPRVSWAYMFVTFNGAPYVTLLRDKSVGNYDGRVGLVLADRCLEERKRFEKIH